MLYQGPVIAQCDFIRTRLSTNDAHGGCDHEDDEEEQEEEEDDNGDRDAPSPFVRLREADVNHRLRTMARRLRIWADRGSGKSREKSRTRNF